MSRTRWTDEQISELVRRYPHERTEDIAHSIGRPVSSTYQKAYALGLHKSAEFNASAASGRTDGTRGTATRFKPGVPSWSKGKKVGMRPGCQLTSFKPGNKPHNHKPVGSERVVDGYLQRKVTDTGYTPRDWVMVHRLIWEEAHGPIPAGSVIVFRDKNRANVSLENLELVPRAELTRRNSIHNWPAELKDAMRDVARLTRAINNKTKEAINGAQ